MKEMKYLEATEFDNIKEIIYNSAEKYKNNTAFILKTKEGKKTEYTNISYKKLLEDINALGTKFYDLGFENKRVAIVGRNKYEWVLTHLTNLLGGIVSIPLDKELQVDELESCILRSKADVVVFDEKYIENIKEIQSRKNVKANQYICMNELEGYIDIQQLKQEGYELIEKGSNEYISSEIDSDKMSILLFTSGTTSKSKAVMLSQKNIASNVYAMQLVERFYETDVNLAFLPFHHIFGSTEMIVMLAFGLATAFPDGLRYIKQNLKEYGVSVFVGVPLLVNKMYENIEKEIEKQGKTKLINAATKISNFLLKFNIDIRRKLFKQVLDGLGGKMRLIISGGAPLDKNVSIKFNELGVRLIQGYGLTETSPVISAENDKYIRNGSVGFPMRHLTVEIVNKDKDGIGEVRVKGPNIMMGYYENEEATNKVLKDGWFYTGDLGYIDNDGFLFLTGREKDVIVMKNGKKVFPEELEVLVNNLPEVEECFIYGMAQKGDKNDPMVSVKIVYNKDAIINRNENELYDILWNEVKEINKTLPPYKYIKNMIITDKPLIKTTTHKIKRKEELARIDGK